MVNDFVFVAPDVPPTLHSDTPAAAPDANARVGSLQSEDANTEGPTKVHSQYVRLTKKPSSTINIPESSLNN